jgi:hypothetical protein
MKSLGTFSRKKYQKLAPEQSPGVPLCRASLRFSNSAPWASDTKNLFTLAPPRSTEISLMGQCKEQLKKDSGQAGMTESEVGLYFVFSAFSVEV